MKILVLGGSQFLGKWFVIWAHKEHDITVFNLGNHPLGMGDVQEIYGDRHIKEDLCKLQGCGFDVVIDFCAYNRGDISSVCEVLGNEIRQYIYVSTMDALDLQVGIVSDESGSLTTDKQNSYGYGKATLERELIACSSVYDLKYTIFRPVYIYGPGNNQGRELIYFYYIEKDDKVDYPIATDSEFQMVYVEDVVKAIFLSVGNPVAYNEIFHLTGNSVETYDSIMRVITKVSRKKFKWIPKNLYEVEYIPYIIRKDDSYLIKGDKALSLIGQYTDFIDGMKKTARWYWGE